MNRHRKLRDHILLKLGDHAVPFDALCTMLAHYGFIERIKGDHHIFTRVGVEEIINIQPLHGKAKAYQVRQIRAIMLRYGIHAEEQSMSARYEIIIYWSAEDQIFIAEVPELPGCMADGPSYQDALANAEVVIREWIETAQEIGRAIPEPRGKLMFA